MLVLVSGFILMSKFSRNGLRGSGICTLVGSTCGSVVGGFGVLCGPILVVYFFAAPLAVII